MNFEISPELRDLQERVRRFVADEIVPMESDARQTPHGPTDELRRELVAKARAAGLLSAHVSPEYGGLGLDHVGKAIVFGPSEVHRWSIAKRILRGDKEARS